MGQKLTQMVRSSRLLRLGYHASSRISSSAVAHAACSPQEGGKGEFVVRQGKSLGVNQGMIDFVR